jgi:hypothetical protein
MYAICNSHIFQGDENEISFHSHDVNRNQVLPHLVHSEVPYFLCVKVCEIASATLYVTCDQ